MAAIPSVRGDARLRILLAVETFTPGADGWRRAGVPLVARTAGVSVETVKRLRPRLVADGLIKYESGRHRGVVSRWYLLIDIPDRPSPERGSYMSDPLSGDGGSVTRARKGGRSPGKRGSYMSDPLSGDGGSVTRARKGGRSPGKRGSLATGKGVTGKSGKSRVAAGQSADSRRRRPENALSAKADALKAKGFSSDGRASRARPGGARAGAPESQDQNLGVDQKPCSRCGKPDGDLDSFGRCPYCVEVATDQFLRSMSIERLIDEGHVREAVERRIRRWAEFPADVQKAHGVDPYRGPCEPHRTFYCHGCHPELDALLSKPPSATPPPTLASTAPPRPPTPIKDSNQ
jgi:hypothetical protein